MYYRHRTRVDVITFVGPDFADAIRDRLDSRNLLFGDVHYYTSEELLSDLTYDQSILGVLDPDPSHALRYGSKGRYCSPEQMNLMGILI